MMKNIFFLPPCFKKNAFLFLKNSNSKIKIGENAEIKIPLPIGDTMIGRNPAFGIVDKKGLLIIFFELFLEKQFNQKKQ